MIQKIRKEIQTSNHNLQNTEMKKQNNYYSLYTITTVCTTSTKFAPETGDITCKGRGVSWINNNNFFSHLKKKKCWAQVKGPLYQKL